MYSRYTPNESGGFDRRQIPDRRESFTTPPLPPPVRNDETPIREVFETTAQGNPPPLTPGGPGPPPHPHPNGPHNGPHPSNPHPNGLHNGPHPPHLRPNGPHIGPYPPHLRPNGPHIGPYPPSHPAPGPVMGGPMGIPSGPGGLFGPNGLLGRFLPRGLETEDLLVLAVLLLAMKQDGADKLELMIAAALYLML